MRSPFSPSPTLELSIAQSLIFLHPQASTSELEPTSDNPLIRGSLVLYLPVKKRVRRLKVVLEGWCDAYGVCVFDRVDLEGEVRLIFVTMLQGDTSTSMKLLRYWRRQ